ncbi:tRNA-binding protein [Nitriliruptor alkaliphilus]|uniref:tRNA-binding protein n=1 Tax=Nitriliruptor alkaliphilus TaxID=427918 RepID=UPI000AB98718|nr:tRNA-binding protein [Nitriliruptor alkaliphilus]
MASSHRIDPDARPYAPEGIATKPEVGFEGFAALDLRIGRVTAVDPFPEARQPAWKLTVDFGPVLGELRTSAKITSYAAEELLGRTVVGAVNLGAKRIAGFTSQFLVLGGLEPDGTVRLLAPDADLAPGSVVG